MRCVGRRSMRSPQKLIDPPVRGANPDTALRTVLLPAPFGPRSATMRPARTVTLTPQSTWKPPYPASRPSMASMALPEVGLAQERIGRNLRRRSGGDNPAEVQSENTIGERHDH